MKIRTLIIGIATILMASCAGLKKKDRPEYDLMDNFTSRFNIIHHARSIIADAEQQNRKAHRENYNHFLPIFIEPSETSISSHTSLMDSVMEKSRRVIDEKSRGKYVDEAYFLIGRSNYLKGNYYNAAEFFSYVASTAIEQPAIQQQALIWQARALMQLGAHNEAGELLDAALTGLDKHKRSRGHAFAVRAHYHLQRSEIPQAIAALTQAIDFHGKNTDKLRWYFLLAQLLEHQNDHQNAIFRYRRVARSNVDYEMAFNAALSRAFLEARVYPDEQRQIRALHTMLRADKNKEFRDQILFYLGEVHHQHDRPEVAIDFFNRALITESTNYYQKATTYMRLADHYFEQRKYPTAIAYYDSTAMVLPIDYPRIEQVQRKLANIGDLINRLQIVERQDSLQSLAGMDELRRSQTIDSIITSRYESLLAANELQQQQAGRSKRRQDHSQNIQLSPFDQLLPGGNTQAFADNRFYFNNPDAIGIGMSAFRRKWGNRPLRDNWRWSDARAAPNAPDSPSTGVESAVPDKIAGGTDPHAASPEVLPDSLQLASMIRQDYESNLPLEPELLATSHTRIKTALESIGELYRFGLQDPQSAADNYRDLLDRYPFDPQRAAWLYHLTILSDADQRTSPMYRSMLLTDFPESQYSKILLDPDYLSNIADEKKRLNEYYNEIYDWYRAGRYEQIIREVGRIVAIPDQKIEHAGSYAQLAYLRALAIGRTAGPDRFKSELRELIDDFPDDSLITPLAKQHVSYMDAHWDHFSERTVALVSMSTKNNRFLDEPGLTRWPQLVIQTAAKQPQGARAESADTAEHIPTRNVDPKRLRDTITLPDSADYYFVINVMHPRVNLAPSRFGIGQFNRSRYSRRSLSHQLKHIEENAQLIYVGPFDSYQDVKQYENRILPLISDIMKVPEEIYNTFVITQSNFGTLSDFEKVNDYVNFYQRQRTL